MNDRIFEQKISEIPVVLFSLKVNRAGKRSLLFHTSGFKKNCLIKSLGFVKDPSKFFERIFPEDLATLEDWLETSRRNLSALYFEYRVKARDNSLRWESIMAKPIHKNDGSIVFSGLVKDITSQKIAEEKVFYFDMHLNLFLSQTKEYIYCKDKELRYVFCSQIYAEHFLGENNIDVIGKTDYDFPQSVMPIEVQIEDQRVLQECCSYSNKQVSFNFGGGKRFLQYSKKPSMGNSSHATGVFFIGHDVTDIVRSRQQEQLAFNVFKNARDSIMITDADGCIVDVNDSFTRITGYEREDVIGKSPKILSSGRHNAKFYAEMWGRINNDGYWTGEIWNKRKDGTLFAALMTISRILDEDEYKNFVAIVTDITELKMNQEALERAANYDSLTGLPNRQLLLSWLEDAIDDCKNKKESLLLLYIDLDGFKTVNDTYGHSIGDTLLKAVANRMQFALRESDFLARIGGDEFIAVLVGSVHPNDTNSVLDRLLKLISDPIIVGDFGDPILLNVSASIGAATYSVEAISDGADMLMRHADQAMYVAKQSGKNQYSFFDDMQDLLMRQNQDLISQIRRGIVENQFCLFYQPKIDLVDSSVIGVEALLRWRINSQEIWAPDRFLPKIENHPVIIEIDEWVILSALNQIQDWNSRGLFLNISVNVSPLHLQKPDFVERLKCILEPFSDAERTQLDLEILESSALGDFSLIQRKMFECLKMGVEFSIDDFGTGYSSLSYLKHLPAQTLKIDQSFVLGMLENDDDHAIVNAVIGLAKSFGREVVAEGVETKAHIEALLKLGCRFAQGYHISKPLDALDFPVWLESWTESTGNNLIPRVT